MVSLEEFQRAHKVFSYLAKEKIEFRIGIHSNYNWPNMENTFFPIVPNIINSEQLSKVFPESEPTPVSAFYPLNSFMEMLVEKCCVEPVRNDHSKLPNSSVKFISTAMLWNNLNKTTAWYITKAPYEEQIGDHTYRTVMCNSAFLLSVNEQNPLYNYLDVGHIIISTNDKKKHRLFVTNQMTLDTNNLMVAFALNPAGVEAVLQNGVFLSGASTKLALLKVEKGMPSSIATEYQAYKNSIYCDFEKNAQHLILNKLTRDEIASITLNDIKITKKSGKYEHVSIEAENFYDVIFKTIDPTADFDIFSLIDIYTDYVENQLHHRPTNTSHTAFQQDFSINFKINDIPLEVGVTTKNSRRKVNGYIINKNELSRVLRRASCHKDAISYNMFVSSVSRMSFMLHNVLANGLPMKIITFSDDREGHAADHRHPKLRFIKRGAVWSIVTLSGEEYPMKKIGAFIKKIYSLNRQARTSYTFQDDGTCVQNTMNSCEIGVHLLLPMHCKTMTEQQRLTVLEDSKFDHLKAIEKSKILLNEVVKTVGAKEDRMNGVKGWTVQGDKLEYFVDTATLKVYDFKSRRYICIVNGVGDQGVGMDGLIGRLLALKNDSRITRHITTL